MSGIISSTVFGNGTFSYSQENSQCFIMGTLLMSHSRILYFNTTKIIVPSPYRKRKLQPDHLKSPIDKDLYWFTDMFMPISTCREGFRSLAPTEAHEQWQDCMEIKASISLLQQKTLWVFTRVTITVQLIQKERSQAWKEGEVTGMRYLTKAQLALGQVTISRGVSSLILGAVLSGRGSRTCSTRLP